MSALKSEQQIAPSELFFSATNQGTDLGARFTAGDGRVYRYAQGSNVALVAGKLYAAPAQDTTNYQNIGVLTAGTLTTTVTTQGTASLTFPSGTYFNGGVLTVRNGQGQGFTYRIKSHNPASAGTATFTLEDPLQVALLGTSSRVDVTPNPYFSVVIAPTTLASTVVGVAVNNTAGSNFGWLQTRGLCNVLSDGAIAVGLGVQASASVSGAVAAVQTVGSQPLVGFAAITTVDTKYCPFFLTIE